MLSKEYNSCMRNASTLTSIFPPKWTKIEKRWVNWKKKSIKKTGKSLDFHLTFYIAGGKTSLWDNFEILTLIFDKNLPMSRPVQPIVYYLVTNPRYAQKCHRTEISGYHSFACLCSPTCDSRWRDAVGKLQILNCSDTPGISSVTTPHYPSLGTYASPNILITESE